MATSEPKLHDEATELAAALAFLGKLSGTYDVSQAIMFGSRAIP